MLLLAKYWKQLAIAVLLIAFSITVVLLNNKIGSLVKDKELLQSQVATQKVYVALQNATILQGKSDYAKQVKKLPSVLRVIETHYETIYSTVEQWKESNATTDCNSAVRYLDSFTY